MERLNTHTRTHIVVNIHCLVPEMMHVALIIIDGLDIWANGLSPPFLPNIWKFNWCQIKICVYLIHKTFYLSLFPNNTPKCLFSGHLLYIKYYKITQIVQEDVHKLYEITISAFYIRDLIILELQHLWSVEVFWNQFPKNIKWQLYLR